jgi:hypothetical protein
MAKITRRIATQDVAFTSAQELLDSCFRIAGMSREVGCSEQTLREMDNDGRLPALRDREGARLWMREQIPRARELLRKNHAAKA